MKPEEQVEGIRAVTAADVLEVAQAIVRPESRSVSFVVPNGGNAGQR